MAMLNNQRVILYVIGFSWPPMDFSAPVLVLVFRRRVVAVARRASKSSQFSGDKVGGAMGEYLEQYFSCTIYIWYIYIYILYIYMIYIYIWHDKRCNICTYEVFIYHIYNIYIYIYKSNNISNIRYLYIYIYIIFHIYHFYMIYIIYIYIIHIIVGKQICTCHKEKSTYHIYIYI